MNKHLLLILLGFGSFGVVADMDKICYVDFELDKFNVIENNCERNNILLMQRIPNAVIENTSLQVINYIAHLCRQDRQINYELNKASDTYELVCVLYSNKPRKLGGWFEQR